MESHCGPLKRQVLGPRGSFLDPEPRLLLALQVAQQRGQGFTEVPFYPVAELGFGAGISPADPGCRSQNSALAHWALSPGAALWGAAAQADVQVESMKCSLKRMLRPEERKELQGVVYRGVEEDMDYSKDSFKVMGNPLVVWSLLEQCGNWRLRLYLPAVF